MFFWREPYSSRERTQIETSADPPSRPGVSLGQQVPPPEAALRSHEVIEAAKKIDETGVPEELYVPTAAGDYIEAGGKRTTFDVEGHRWNLLEVVPIFCPLFPLTLSRLLRSRPRIFCVRGGECCVCWGGIHEKHQEKPDRVLPSECAMHLASG